MSHTPGPWIPQNVGGKGWFIVTESDLILAMTLKGDKTDETDEADARLAAAAPELLDALLGLLATEDASSGWCHWCDRAMDRLCDLDDCPGVIAWRAIFKARMDN